MSTAGYLQFLRNMGHRVVQVSGVTWFDPAPRVFMPVPFELQIDPRTFDWRALFAQGCIAARCLVPAPFGRPSYLLVIEDGAYDLVNLDGKTRNQTRRGLEACTVREMSFSELAGEGVALQRDTLTRQGRHVPRDLDRYWSRYFAAAARTEGALTWGAFRGDTLAAYLIAFEIAGTVNVVIVRSAAALLKHYPNNALLFTFIRHMLRDAGVRRVSIGFEPLQANLTSLDHFKEGLGFRRLAVHQYVRLAPPLPALLRRPLLAGSIACLKLLPRSEVANKVAGLLECYANQKA